LEGRPCESHENAFVGEKWPNRSCVGKRVGKQGQATLRAPKKSWW